MCGIEHVEVSKTDAVSQQTCMIDKDLAGQWTKLGLPGSCPYLPSVQELAQRQEQYRKFDQVHELKQMLGSVQGTDEDDWVSAEEVVGCAKGS